MDEITKHIQELSSEELEVRRNAASVLGESGDPSAVPALIKALGDEDETVRKAAVGALGEIGICAVPALLEAMKNKDWFVRWNAADALGEIAKKNSGNGEILKAVPALIEALKDTDKSVLGWIAKALVTVIDSSSVAQLDKLKAQIIETVEKADKYDSTYREMKKAAVPLIVAIYTRRNTLLSVEVNIDPAMVLKRPKPPKGSSGMYRMPAFAGVN